MGFVSLTLIWRFAVGDTGTVLRTTDGGISWVEVQIGTNKKLKDICFVNEYTGWIVGGNDSEVSPDTGIVLHTTNGGTSWTQQTCDASWQLNGVCFINENIGWVVGGGGGAFFSDNRIILHTTDGGSNWLLQLSDLLPRLRDVCFLNNNIGWAVGGARGLDYGIDGIIIGTTDGGATWTTLQYRYRIFNGISMFNHNLGFVVGSGLAEGCIVSTNDGFSSLAEQMIGGDLRSVSFIDAFTGWAVGTGGTILHTTNGGVVPVELNSFTATANGKEVTLNWSTATEMNNQGFEVQRKFGSNDFVTIGSVKGHGTTTTPNNYTYVDKLLSCWKIFLSPQANRFRRKVRVLTNSRNKLEPIYYLQA